MGEMRGGCFVSKVFAFLSRVHQLARTGQTDNHFDPDWSGGSYVQSMEVGLVFKPLIGILLLDLYTLPLARHGCMKMSPTFLSAVN